MSKGRNKYEGALPGPFVMIHGRRHPTIVDAEGVQRFPANRILVDLLREGALDLNKISRLFQEGNYHVEEIEQLDRLLGVSVSMYVGQHSPGGLVDNPLWYEDEAE